MWPSMFDAEDAILALAQLQGGLAFGSITGKTKWVDSAQTTSQEAGTYLEPFLTIQAAIDDCVSARGDVVLVKPTHEEDLDASGAGIDFTSKIGVKLAGLQQGQLRPKVTFSHADAYVNVAATGCCIANIWFENQVNTLVKFIHVNGGHGARIENCLFTTSDTAYEVTNFIVVYAAYDVTIIGNTFGFDGVDAGGSGLICQTTVSRLTIRDNVIFGDFGAGYAIEISTAPSRTILVLNNKIYAEQAVQYGGIYIDGGAGDTTGVLDGNKGYVNHANAINAEKTAPTENYFTSSLGSSGTLDP